MSDQGQHYTFGNNLVAADRLALLAEVFEPTTRELLTRLRRRCASDGPYEVIDFACGPGATSRLLARELRPRRVLGLDVAEGFLERASRESAAEQLPCPVEFLRHDVTESLEGAAAAVGYCRYLLTHLAEPAAALRAMAASLAPFGTGRGALLALEENSALGSEDPVLGRYYEYVERLQAHYDQAMCVGLRLPELVRSAGLTLEEHTERTCELDPAAMATLHALNLQTWSRDPYAQRAFDARELAQLSEALLDIAARRRPALPSVVTLTQVIARVA